MECLLKLQKQAVRIVTGSDYLAPSLPLFLRLKIIPITFQFKINKLIMVFKCKHNLAPGYLANKFVTGVHDVTGRQTRSVSDDKLFLPYHKPTYSKSFEISGIKLWNSLPAYLRKYNSVGSFRKSLCDHIFSKLGNFAEISDMWCSICSISQQLDSLFCEHLND